MVKEFNPKKKEAKDTINATIDKSLNQMIKDAGEKYGLNYSTTLNEILDYFRDEYYNVYIKDKKINEVKEMKD